MARRFVSIWFQYLATDWFVLQQPLLNNQAFVLKASSHGRIVVTAANALARQQGLQPGMALADARAILPSLQAFDDKPMADKLLHRIAEWCIRFTPVAATDPPDGIILDVTGCTHLWGGDTPFLKDIISRLQVKGYNVRAAIADTIGAAWALARFGKKALIVDSDQTTEALLCLPTAALRLEMETIERLQKLGLRQIKDFIGMPRSALRRRFGYEIVTRLNQALGMEEEFIQPVQPLEPYNERLPCLEPIVTATGIEIALQQLLKALCERLQKEQKGLRHACLSCYRTDGKIQQVQIETIRASHSVKHLFNLFETKLASIEPDLGIELFVLSAPKVEEHLPAQQKLWEQMWSLDHVQLSELMDRIAGKVGSNVIRRYLPNEHYLPERSIKAATVHEQKTTHWQLDRPRPIQLLPTPETIQVTAPVPDNPPMNFRYKGKLHKIKKADGPERIEQEWWLQDGQHRDYYVVEDEEGCRYWVFRLGHYNEDYQWFVHGFFA